MLWADGPVRFESFVLDTADAQLLGAHGPVHLGRKAFGVLAALVARPGRLLTKEELFDSVWDGAIVSESVLTSAIKELRRVLGDESKHPRFIESVYGRGYRFIAPVAPTPRHTLATDMSNEWPVPTSAVMPDSAPVSRPHVRRAVLAWGAAGVVAAAGAGFGIYRSLTPALPPEVPALIAQSCSLMDQNTPEGHNQAIGLLRRVVELAPDYADGWGLLGVVYAAPVPSRERAEGLMLRARARAAAARALALDSGNSLGQLVLAIELPIIGHWRERDRHFARALAGRPVDDRVLTFAGANLHASGYPSAAIPLYDRVRERPLRPFPYSNYIRALWSAGRLEETDRALDDATVLYPTQGNIWWDRYTLYLYGGRPDAALTLVRTPAGRAPDLDDKTLADLAAMAQAMLDPRSAGAERTLAALVGEARKAAAEAQSAIRFAGAIGALDTAFELAAAYFFNRGFAIPDFATPGSTATLDQRRTRFLFEPTTAALRADQRFEALVADLGLDAYWRASGKQPDYRLQRRG